MVAMKSLLRREVMMARPLRRQWSACHTTSIAADTRLSSQRSELSIPRYHQLGLPQRSAFHSTPTVDFAVRRRKRPANRGGASNNDDENSEDRKSPLSHEPVDDDVEFVQGASALLDKLQIALEPMKPLNDTFEVERFFGDMGEVLTINLGPKEGKYRIEMSLEDHMFEYTSPISGKVLYILSAETGEWVGIEDGHSFEGLLVRDLNRQCQGLPKL